jgi:hypothetical protein
MSNPAKYVHPINFSGFSGAQFERLVFAFHAHSESWQSLEWYGQIGADLGRDIWGIRKSGESVCIQCVNRKSLEFTKIKTDLAKILKSDHGIPQHFRVVASCEISARTRDSVHKHTKSIGISSCDLWSGSEFEEFLRRDAGSIVRRFVDGEAFPDDPQELLRFGKQAVRVTDQQILSQYAKLFDRAAFYTPISIESNLQDFKQAITDTIQVLGTGIRKTRDGDFIEQLPSRHDLKGQALRQKLQSVEVALARLRGRFDEMVRDEIVKRCNCNDPKCPVYFMPHHAASELESLRSEVLSRFRDAYPPFRPATW